MEIYGSLVLLARHCPNIEDRCFSRQFWRRGWAFEVALTVSVRAPARGPCPLAPPLRSGHPVKGAHPLHNPRSNPTPCIVVVATRHLITATNATACWSAWPGIAWS